MEKSLYVVLDDHLDHMPICLLGSCVLKISDDFAAPNERNKKRFDFQSAEKTVKL